LFDNDISAEQDLSGFELGDQVENIIEASPVCEKAMDAATAAVAATDTDEDDDIFNTPITGFSKKRKATPSLEKKQKRSKDLSTSPMFHTVDMVKEIGETVELVVNTEKSFIKPDKNGKKMFAKEERFNFFLATIFALAGNFEHLRAYNSEIDDEVLSGIASIIPHCRTSSGAGYTDVFIRRLALYSIFAISEDTSTHTHSGKILSRILLNKTIGIEKITKSNVRSIFTHVNEESSKRGFKYLEDINGTEKFFHVRVETD